jgi:hypothetical protein
MGFLRVGASLSVRGRQLDNVDTAESLARNINEAGIPLTQVTNAFKLLPVQSNERDNFGSRVERSRL